MHTVKSPSLQFRHLLLALVLALAVAPAWAQKRVALVMGNAQYQQEAALRNPLNDASLLARTLKANPLKFDDVLTLNDGSRGQMLQQLARFSKLAQGADVAVLYYSGHGMINSKRQNHVLPVDMPRISANADLDTDAVLKSYGISETELIEAVEGAKVQVVVLDACRDNGFGGQKSGTKGLARRPDQSRNRLIAYATEEGYTAEDGKGQNSTYAQSLARHLVRTDLPLLTVFDEVANDVERQTANKQSPTRSGNLRTNVYLLASLVPVPISETSSREPSAASAAQIEQQAWSAAQSINNVAAYRAYLNDYPNGEYSAAARVAVAGLKSTKPEMQSDQTISGRYQILAGGAEVKDIQTNLIWQRCQVGQPWNGSTCEGEVKSFTAEEAQKQAPNGWRIPSVDEVRTLVSKDRANGLSINALAFPNSASHVWSVSDAANSSAPTLARILFSSGMAYFSLEKKSIGDAVRLVRAGS